MADVTAIAPHLLEAERAVLGVALEHPERLFEVIEAVAPADFFRDAHRKICQAIVDVAARGQGVDALTVRDQLHSKGLVEDVGGPAFITSLADGVPRSTNVEAYARIVASRPYSGASSKSQTRCFKKPPGTTPTPARSSTAQSS